MSSISQESLQNILIKYQNLSDTLARGNKIATNDFAKITKEFSELAPIVEKINTLFKKQKYLEELQDILSKKDLELKEMAEEEKHDTQKAIANLYDDIKIMLLPKDEDDSKNVILEIRAGTGGDEASLFAADLFRMYQRYSERRKWQLEIISFSDTGKGGYKEIICQISGSNVFARLKFESGVHRVQRVPETEASGRLHTSASTVAVLPEAQEVDVKIDPKDLRIDVFRASGAGGQHVNTTDSAVRITHIPTGTVVSQQDEKSQHKNKAKAMKILLSRIYDKQKLEQENQRKGSRKEQVGSGDRSARIRTYNFPQARLTEHRINLTLYKLSAIMDGDLDEIIDALVTFDQSQKLANA